MKKMLPYFIALTLSACSCSTTNSQYYFYNEDYYESAFTWQTGISVGGMNCLTDLGGKKGVGRKFIKDINWNATQPCGSFFIGTNYKDVVGLRLELTFGQVKANDNALKNDRSEAYWRYLRNLNFRSDIRELSFMVEFYPYTLFGSGDTDPPFISPYITGGIGSFSFNPETFYNNTWINVAALHTEGEGFDEYPDRKMYKLTQWNMPLGLGIKYEVSPVINFKFEIVYRKLWTDYLDDVSKSYVDPQLFKQHFNTSTANLAIKLSDPGLMTDQGLIRTPGDSRGNDKNNDAYFSGAIKLSVTLGRQRR